jgi:hypothetical protein
MDPLKLPMRIFARTVQGLWSASKRIVKIEAMEDF